MSKGKTKVAFEELRDNFKTPPPGFGVSLFYWWLGDKLTKERMRWQLDKIKDHSVIGLQVCYAHDNKGGRYLGMPFKSDPPQRNEQWWELFNWLVEQGKEDGFAVSLSDYTLCWPGQGDYGDIILEEHPDTVGRELRSIEHKSMAGEEVTIEIPANALTVAAVCEKKGIKDLLPLVLDNKLQWNAEFDCTIVIVYPEKKEYTLDPMNPILGSQVCEKFYQAFLDRNPGEEGKGINYFFSDELMFGVRGNLWNDHFASEFKARKGYDITPYLPALFVEAGDITPKVRLDYYDVIVQLEEEHYFKPLYDWHESRGMTFGGDHGGRGKDITEFGDYFRTQRYNQGPGCDQSFLESDIIKNKVASSISHLYERPRVWLEGFHSSGWGTTSQGLQDAIARNYCMGHNFLSIHGFYYSTYGGWWEWAPPCNTFRMPYWNDLKHLLKATERLSYLLSRGVHCCDVAVIYPVAAVEGGYDGEKSVDTAFECVETLYKNGIDVDFIDFESIDRAAIKDKRLEVGGEKYQIIVIPSMKTVRHSMIEKLLEFKKSGGIVINVGSLPEYSDRKGANDAELFNIVKELSADSTLVLEKPEDVVPLVKRLIRLDFNPDYSGSDIYINHRQIDDLDLYMVYGVPKGTRCYFRTQGKVSLWNPYDGLTYGIDDAQQAIRGTYVRLPLDKSEFQILIFDKSGTSADLPIEKLIPNKEEATEVIKLDNKWDFELVPCLDNRYGDFYLPASNELVGPWIYRLSYCESNNDELPDEKDYNQSTLYTHGPYFLHKGRFTSEDEYNQAVESALKGELSSFEDYIFSMRYGVESDPGEQGFHGLKTRITDDFLIIGERQENWMTRVWYENFPGSFGEVFYTNVYADEPIKANILTGDLKPDSLYVNGVKVENLNNGVFLNKGFNSVVIGYKNPGRTHLIFTTGDLEPQNYPLSMKWYNQENVLEFSSFGYKAPRYCYFRYMSPPALERMEIPTDLKLKVWVEGREVTAINREKGICTVTLDKVNPYSCEVVIRVEYSGGSLRGAVFNGPIKLKCGKGIIESGDWSEIDGLRGYSGGARYFKTINLTKEQLDKQIVIELEDVVSTVSLYVNDRYAGTKVAPSWHFDISDFVVEGENKICFEVYNTLSNHYDSIPTNYRGSLKSGLIGDTKVYII